MDIPRIGYGALYRPPQVGVGRGVDGDPEQPDARSTTGAPGTPDTKALNAKTSGAQQAGGGKVAGTTLSEDEQKQVNKLKSIDAKVRQHEAAHQAAGGGLVGGASFTYTKGPDGQSYATGGEVPITAPAARSPSAAIQQAQQVKAAALAPADPSGQDLSVAAAAEASQAQAQRQLNSAGDSTAAGQTGASQASTGQTATGQTNAGQPGGVQGGEAQGSGRPSPTGAPDGAAQGEPVPGLPVVTAQASDVSAAIPALVARGVAAYGAAARVNAAPSYATALFA